MQATLCGFSLAITPNEACYVPLAHRKRGADEGLFDAGLEAEQIRESEAIEAMKPVLEDPGILKIGHNLKFNWLVFAQRGVAIAPLDDTLLQSYVLDAGRSEHDVALLATRYLDYTTIDFSVLIGSGKSRVTFDNLEIDKASEYAAEKADITLRLWLAMKPRLTADRMTSVYETLERPMVAVLARMEQRGISIDRQVLARLSGEFAQGVRTPRAGDPEGRRATGQSRQPQTAGRRSVRLARPARRNENQNRRVVDIGVHPRRSRRTRPRIAAEDSRLAAGLEVALDLYRCAAELRQSENASRAHKLRFGGDHDRPAFLVRA